MSLNMSLNQYEDYMEQYDPMRYEFEWGLEDDMIHQFNSKIFCLGVDPDDTWDDLLFPPKNEIELSQFYVDDIPF